MQAYVQASQLHKIEYQYVHKQGSEGTPPYRQ